MELSHESNMLCLLALYCSSAVSTSESSTGDGCLTPLSFMGVHEVHESSTRQAR